jgi:riboflavin kinase/FMN adenylyltransferase
LKEHKGANAFKSDRPTVITIGTFDGVHAGHQKIIERLITAAKANNMESAILTFFPHPRMVLQKEGGLKLINTIDERKELLEKSGIDHLIIHPFTRQFSRLSALEFVRDILVNKLKAKKVIIGYDHRFGRNRTADISDLR